MKFSIVIPCYNAVDYVDRSIGSAVRQNFPKTEYEIIAVNDASTDDTLSKLNSWKEKYPGLVKVVSYEENLRQGGARNVAMRSALGEYICFLDADDRMDKQCLKKYDILIEDTHADMVVSRHVDETEFVASDEETTGEPDTGDNVTVNYDNLTILSHDSDFSRIVSSDFGYVWCACYRKSMILDNDLFFPEKLAYEDLMWPRIVRLYADKICICEEITHHKYDNPVSTMNKKDAPHHLDRLTVYEMLLAEYRRLGVMDREYLTLLNETMETYFFNSYYMFFTRMQSIPDVYARIRNVIYEYFPDWEEKYDDSDLPMYFQYFIKLLKRIPNASPEDLVPFKESLLELIE